MSNFKVDNLECNTIDGVDTINGVNIFQILNDLAAGNTDAVTAALENVDTNGESAVGNNGYITNVKVTANNVPSNYRALGFAVYDGNGDRVDLTNDVSAEINNEQFYSVREDGQYPSRNAFKYPLNAYPPIARSGNDCWIDYALNVDTVYKLELILNNDQYSSSHRKAADVTVDVTYQDGHVESQTVSTDDVSQTYPATRAGGDAALTFEGAEEPTVNTYDHLLSDNTGTIETGETILADINTDYGEIGKVYTRLGGSLTLNDNNATRFSLGDGIDWSEGIVYLAQ